MSSVCMCISRQSTILSLLFLLCSTSLQYLNSNLASHTIKQSESHFSVSPYSSNMYLTFRVQLVHHRNHSQKKRKDWSFMSTDSHLVALTMHCYLYPLLTRLGRISHKPLAANDHSLPLLPIHNARSQ